MNPDTPYKGLLMFHGVGTGKCVLPGTKVYINDEILNVEQIWNKYYTINTLISDNENGVWSNPLTLLTTSSIDINNNKICNGIITRLYR